MVDSELPNDDPAHYRSTDRINVPSFFCNGSLKRIILGCRCEFTGWSEWSSCEASLGGGFQQRERDWKVKDGQTGQMCPTRPRHPDYTLQERRDGSPDGAINCLQNTAMSLHAGLKEAGRYKDLVILLDESTSIKVNLTLQPASLFKTTIAVRSV